MMTDIPPAIASLAHAMNPMNQKPQTKPNVLLRTGDVDPFNYGGGVVFEQPETDTIEWWFWSGCDEMVSSPENELDAHFRVYRLTVPANVFEEYDWAEWTYLGTFTGDEDIHKSAKSDSLQERIFAMEAIRDYHGPDAMCFYPTTMTGHELAAKFGTEG